MDYKECPKCFGKIRVLNKKEIHDRKISNIDGKIIAIECTECGYFEWTHPLMQVPTLKCNRCNHSWHPRSSNEPKNCPKCNSPYWNKDRVR